MIPRYTGGSYYRRAKGKGILVKRQRPLLANIYSPEYLPVPRPLALYNSGPVLKTLA